MTIPTKFLIAAYVLIGLTTPCFADDGEVHDCIKGLSLLSMTNGRQQFKETEISPGKCKMVEDKESEIEMAKEDEHRKELWYALQTRVLTQKEMAEVRAYGERINTETMVPYSEADKQAERNSAFLQQARLQAIAHGKILP